MKHNISGLRIHIQGIVQGVGFRPFIYNLALKHNLKGWVKNDTNGVEIEVNGDNLALRAFTESIETKAPPLAIITSLDVKPVPANGYPTFEILSSSLSVVEFVPIAPDIGLCEECLSEFNDKGNRRFHYPFINCTNCGPRFTIIRDIPYDRQLTTMAHFLMCQACASEYNDPANRRFHAQPIACPDCGPHIWNESGMKENMQPGEPSVFKTILEFQENIILGYIVAVKGLGGFHLACDAMNSDAVQTLRLRKKRDEKPFALMMPDISTINEHCFISSSEEKLLVSPERPIVILKRRKSSNIATEIAPGQDTIGVMLPYTPLHHLLFKKLSESGGVIPCKALVMTSGNISDLPIAYDNLEAKQKLKDIADVFLMHNRPIHTKCDDSLARTIKPGWTHNLQKDEQIYILRRARGYTPVPLTLPWESNKILAVGAELKNSFCLTRNKFAFNSQYLGDLQNYETYETFEKMIEKYELLYRIDPEIIACDLHPDYLSTRYAMERGRKTGKPVVQVQHHHAHLASVMVENGLKTGTQVIGLAFDGTGFGEDGHIWGGEVMIASYNSYHRSYSLDYFPLPGGDLAIKSPSRTALALLWQNKIEWFPELSCVKDYCTDDLLKIKSQLQHQINTPLTSSMGRLFDAVASLTGVRQRDKYEAQAAIELETRCDPDEVSYYEFYLSDGKIIYSPMIKSIVEEVLAGVPASIIAAKFHNTIVEIAKQVVEELTEETGIRNVALSGGVFQNMRILESLIPNLLGRDLRVYIHQKYPTNDGGISLGQAAIAQHWLLDGKH